MLKNFNDFINERVSIKLESDDIDEVILRYSSATYEDIYKSLDIDFKLDDLSIDIWLYIDLHIKFTDEEKSSICKIFKKNGFDCKYMQINNSFLLEQKVDSEEELLKWIELNLKDIKDDIQKNVYMDSNLVKHRILGDIAKYHFEQFFIYESYFTWIENKKFDIINGIRLHHVPCMELITFFIRKKFGYEYLNITIPKKLTHRI